MAYGIWVPCIRYKLSAICQLVFVGCAQRTSQSRINSRVGQRSAKKKILCHFDPFGDAQDRLREKSFLDPSHSLGMTGGVRQLCVLRVLARTIRPVMNKSIRQKHSRAKTPRPTKRIKSSCPSCA